jgi:hypothetical protein
MINVQYTILWKKPLGTLSTSLGTLGCSTSTKKKKPINNILIGG